MKINFTKKQYLALMKLVYLGNWVANANRTDNMLKDYESTEDYIFSFAKEFGFERYVDHEAKDGDRYFPTRWFEEETDVDILIAEYDNDSFWDELIDRLAQRDLVHKFGIEGVVDLEDRERWIQLSRSENIYSAEFQKNELDNIVIQGSNL